MKTKLLPLYFLEANEREEKERKNQLQILSGIYGDDAELLPEQPLGSIIPEDVDAILFPQLIGAIFNQKEIVKKISLPIIVITSGFGTVEMWDWEIVAYLKEELELTVFTPYTVDLGKVILRAISAKKFLNNGMKFLMFQDDPGEGMQPEIFKRFYWWEKECTEQIEKAFGLKIVYKSWTGLNEKAKAVSDEEARILWEQRKEPVEGVSDAAVLKAVKLYIAIKEVIAETGDVGGAGANCLNESFHCNTTPCLAWNWIFEYDNIIWACEGDTVTLISKYVLYSALQKPMMMTNIYPFLVGMAALKHEKIKEFPKIDDPDNHALGVHCGYFGFAPKVFCTSWVIRPKALAIVDEDAIVIDCRLAAGPITMAKLHPNMKTLTVIEAEIEDYVQYPGSDCRNGALIRYKNRSGHQVMESLSSHHAIIIQGDVTFMLRQLAKVYDFAIEVI